MSNLYFVRPLQLRDYLKHSGWESFSDGSQGEYVFRRTAEKREIRFPVDEADPDYQSALEFAYIKLGGILNQSVRDLYQDILLTASDMVHLRLGTAGDQPSISFDLAERSVAAIERLLRSSSSTVRKPQANHKRMSFVEASKVLQKARLEQTAIGSFVFRVSCPLDALQDEMQLPLHLAGKSFVRLVFENIHDATNSVVRAIVSDSVERFADELLASDAPQISSNFCEALAQIADFSERQSEIGFTWSPIVSKAPTKSLRLSSEYVSRLEKLSQRLKGDDVINEEVFVGTVERLDGQIGNDGRRAGEVILAIFDADDNTTTRARTELNADQYQIADEAHMAGNALVRVKGKLAPGRQPRRLEVIEFGRVV